MEKKKQWHVAPQALLQTLYCSAFAAFCCFYPAGVLYWLFFCPRPLSGHTTPCENLPSFSNKFARRKGMARALV